MYDTQDMDVNTNTDTDRTMSSVGTCVWLCIRTWPFEVKSLLCFRVFGNGLRDCWSMVVQQDLKDSPSPRR